jgi:hypothetical protein
VNDKSVGAKYLFALLVIGGGRIGAQLFRSLANSARAIAFAKQFDLKHSTRQQPS